MLKKFFSLSVLTSIIFVNLFANEDIRWNDQILQLSPSNYFENRFNKLHEDVEYRLYKYFDNYSFAPWQTGKSEDVIKEEFLKLTELRGNIWFDTHINQIERGWREDFKPNFELLMSGYVRNPNCIAFDYNSVGNYYNGSLVEVNGLKFLALEGPLDKSVNHFFYALLDTNAPLLVRLTPEKEKDLERCTHYWNGRLCNGNQLSIPRHLGNPKNIYYISTDEWKDNSGTNAKFLLDLVLQAKSLYDPSIGPIAVHCSGGVGRTGTFIAAYCLIHEIDSQIASGISIEKLKLSIENLVARLSLQRYHMVARPSQYLNLYQMVNIYLNNYVSSHINQKWEIDENELRKKLPLSYSIEKFSDVLLRAGIEVKLLKKANQSKIYPSENQLTETTKKIDNFLYQEKKAFFPIWENTFIQVYMPQHLLVENHVIIKLRTSNTKLSEVSLEEGLELLKTIQKVGNILRKKFGYSGYVISRSNTDPSICNIFPPSQRDFSTRDQFEKAIRNKDTLFPKAQNMPNELSYEATEQYLKELSLQWQEAMKKSYKYDNEKLKDWNMITINNAKAQCYLTTCIAQSLRNLEVSIKITTLDKADETSKLLCSNKISDVPILTHHTGCPFCNKDVIDHQKCFEYKGILVLYNYQSPLNKYHFMLVPKEHIQNIEGLSEEQLKNIHLIETKLIEILENKFGHPNIKLFVQNGSPSVGQTVPHFHEKIVVTHNGDENHQALLFSLFSLEYIQGNVPKVSKEEMINVTSEINESLKKYF